VTQAREEKPKLSARFVEALVYTCELHRHQVRKGTQIPYIAHLLSVAGLVLEQGGSEDEAIAALLHDAVEDQGGLATLENIRRIFGKRVAEIVEGCTDAVSEPKPPWRARKEKYLRHLEHSSPEILLVSLADKVHNARSILADLRQQGEDTWARFNGGKEGTLWYYHSLVEVFARRVEAPLVIELARIVDEIDEIVQASEEKKG